MKRRPKGAPRFVNVRHVRDAPTILWDLLEEREPHMNISHVRMPTAEEHLDFVTHHPYKAWFLIKADGEWVGSAYITRAREIGIFVFKAHRGKGHGTWAVREMQRRNGAKSILANVAPGNEQSKSFFEHLGFRCVQHTYKCDPPSSSPSSVPAI